MKILVVGGGFAGLSAATRLADEGHSITLIYRHAGGRAYSISDEKTGNSIDNGQHLFMGCYSAARNFLSRIGSQMEFRDLELALVDGDQRISLKPAKLPPPFHAVGWLSALPLLDRLQLVKMAASLKLPTARIPEPSDWETVDAWLDRLSQSAVARRRLWHPLAIGTLNDDPRTASAKMFGAVIREVLMGSQKDAQIGAPKVGLSSLYVEPALHYLRERNQTIKEAAVEELVIAGSGGEAVVRGVRLKSGEELGADAVIAAVPPASLHAMIPASIRSGEPYFENLPRLSSSPIVSIHLWLDRKIVSAPMTGLCDRPIHWIFDRGTHLSLVVSAARELVDRSPDEIVALAMNEVRRAIPRDAKLVHARVLKEREATIAHAAGSEVYRPRARSPVGGLFVAGDYVRTGLPATIESAVRAADEACALAHEYQPPAQVPATPGLISPARLKRA